MSPAIRNKLQLPISDLPKPLQPEDRIYAQLAQNKARADDLLARIRQSLESNEVISVSYGNRINLTTDS